jgi:hypothetical protein
LRAFGDHITNYSSNSTRYHNTSENSETTEMCAWTFAAGDWDYCGDKSVFASDFPAGMPFPCMSFPNSHALIDPSSRSQFTQYGIGGSKFMIQKMWNLASKGCASQIEGESVRLKLDYLWTI